MSKKIIKINRGDSYSFGVRIPMFDSTAENYILTDKDVLYFAIMHPHQRFEDAILIKGYTYKDQDIETGEFNIKVTPNDTRELSPGVYYYTVKLQRGGTIEIVSDFDEPEEVRTIIERTKFIINE